jgi:hypothetical protein
MAAGTGASAGADVGGSSFEAGMTAASWYIGVARAKGLTGGWIGAGDGEDGTGFGAGSGVV